MRPLRRHLLRLALLALAPVAVQAQSTELRQAAGVAVGVWGSIAVHEAGHAAVAWAQGASSVRIRIPGEQCRLLCGMTQVEDDRPLSPAERRARVLAGFVAANAVGEALLHSDRGVRSAAGQTFLVASLYSNVAHVWTYYRRVRGVDGYAGNDIDAYELAGGSPHLLSGLLIGYSAWTLQRLHQREVPLFVGRWRF